LNGILDEAGFDEFVEDQCAPSYAERMGRPSMPPAVYFRMQLIGYFEGIDSERGIAWHVADSLAPRSIVRRDTGEAYGSIRTSTNGCSSTLPAATSDW
jgi:hypothetical protein